MLLAIEKRSTGTILREILCLLQSFLCNSSNTFCCCPELPRTGVCKRLPCVDCNRNTLRRLWQAGDRNWLEDRCNEYAEPQDTEQWMFCQSMSKGNQGKFLHGQPLVDMYAKRIKQWIGGRFQYTTSRQRALIEEWSNSEIVRSIVNPGSVIEVSITSVLYNT